MLQDDNIIVEVLYNGECIDLSANNTWNNIKDSDLIEAYLDLVVGSYLKQIKSNKFLDEISKELDWV